jgi:integrase
LEVECRTDAMPVIKSLGSATYDGPMRSFRDRARTLMDVLGAKANSEDFTFYDLRHTFGSWLIMEGEEIWTAKELMGHRHITMTDRYTHLSQKHLRTAMERLSHHVRRRIQGDQGSERGA